MAFEQNNFSVAKKSILPKGELTIECNLSAGANVAKVLAVTTDVGVSSQEVLKGTINYSGTIDTKVVFLTDNNEISTICNSCPFSSKFESEDIEMGQIAFIENRIIDYNCEILGGENIRVVVFLEQSGFVLGNKTVETIKCNDDDFCYKNEEIQIVKYIGSANETITTDSEINLRENIKKILLTESKTLVRNVEAGVNFVTVSGDVATRVLYLSENDKFESGYVYDSFKEEVELEGVARDSIVEGSACVIQDKVKTEIVQEEKGGKIVIKIPLQISVRAFANETIEVINDVYGTKRGVRLSMQSFGMTGDCKSQVVEGKIEGNLTLDDDQPRVDKLLFNGGNSVTITNSYLKDGEVYIEGIAKTNVVYLNDENSSLHSVALDVPFVISDKFMVEEGGMLSVMAMVCDADVVVKKGREFYYDAKIKATVSYCRELLGGVISEAVMEEDYPEKDYGMEIIFARAGKTLWEVAKTAHVKEEQILAQNPDVIFPVEEDSALILFHQRIQ